MNQFFTKTGELTLWVSSQPETEQREVYDRKRMKISLEYFRKEDASFKVRITYVVTRNLSKSTRAKISDSLLRPDFSRILRESVEQAYKELSTIANTRPGDYFLAAHAMNKSIQERQGIFKIHKLDYEYGFYRFSYTIEDQVPKAALLTILRDLDKLAYLTFKRNIDAFNQSKADRPNHQAGSNRR